MGNGSCATAGCNLDRSAASGVGGTFLFARSPAALLAGLCCQQAPSAAALKGGQAQPGQDVWDVYMPAMPFSAEARAPPSFFHSNGSSKWRPLF